MAYQLSEVTIRTSNSESGMKTTEELWRDITNGTLPILFDSEHHFQQGISPVSRYSRYTTDETGEFDLTVLAVTADFFRQMEALTEKGLYQKYDTSDAEGDVGTCVKKAWGQVWADQKSGSIRRAYTSDYESSVPAEYTKDGRAHCYLYIAVQAAAL